jgi:hypothetical protein
VPTRTIVGLAGQQQPVRRRPSPGRPRLQGVRRRDHRRARAAHRGEAATKSNYETPSVAVASVWTTRRSRSADVLSGADHRDEAGAEPTELGTTVRLLDAFQQEGFDPRLDRGARGYPSIHGVGLHCGSATSALEPTPCSLFQRCQDATGVSIDDPPGHSTHGDEMERRHDDPGRSAFGPTSVFTARPARDGRSVAPPVWFRSHRDTDVDQWFTPACTRPPTWPVATSATARRAVIPTGHGS